VNAVAKALGMSARTLQRKLAMDNMQFADLVDDVRRDVALVLLREQHMSVFEVGARLGYRDVQSFRGAFVRWTGETPRAYRTQALDAKRTRVRGE
jgi:AraC-like DNA-binding protein